MGYIILARSRAVDRTYGKATNEARIHQRKLEEHDTLGEGGVMVREAGPEKSLIFVRAGLCTCYVHIWRKQTKVDVQYFSR